MKRILLTTALAALTATPALAQGAGPDDLFVGRVGQEQIRASEFIGHRLYTMETTEGADMAGMAVNDPADNWNDIGEINDVLLSRDGSVEAVLVDIGGFLGIGEKTVAVRMDQLKMVNDGDDPDDFFVVFTASRPVLENAPEFEGRADMSAAGGQTMPATQKADMSSQSSAMNTQNADAMPKDSAMAQDTAQSGKADNMGQTAGADQQAARSADGTVTPVIIGFEYQREGYEQVRVDQMTAEDLTGAPVYGVNDERIGEISELLITQSGNIPEAVIDVGGFLGLGERPVAVSFEDLSIQRATDGGDVRVYMNATEEELKAMPEYQG